MDIKKICGNCKYWKYEEIKRHDGKAESYGKCKRLSVAGLTMLTAHNDNSDCDYYKAK